MGLDKYHLVHREDDFNQDGQVIHDHHTPSVLSVPSVVNPPHFNA